MACDDVERIRARNAQDYELVECTGERTPEGALTNRHPISGSQITINGGPEEWDVRIDEWHHETLHGTVARDAYVATWYRSGWPHM